MVILYITQRLPHLVDNARHWEKFPCNHNLIQAHLMVGHPVGSGLTRMVAFVRCVCSIGIYYSRAVITQPDNSKVCHTISWPILRLAFQWVLGLLEWQHL